MFCTRYYFKTGLGLCVWGGWQASYRQSPFHAGADINLRLFAPIAFDFVRLLEERFNGENTICPYSEQLLSQLNEWHGLMRRFGDKVRRGVRHRMECIVDDLAVVNLCIK